MGAPLISGQFGAVVYQSDSSHRKLECVLLQGDPAGGVRTIDSGGLMAIRGTMACRAYVNNRATCRDATNVSTCVPM